MAQAKLRCSDFRVRPGSTPELKVGSGWHLASEIQSLVGQTSLEPIVVITDLVDDGSTVGVQIGRAWHNFDDLEPILPDSVTAYLRCDDVRFSPAAEIRIAGTWYLASVVNDLIDTDLVTPLFIFSDWRVRGGDTQLLLGQTWINFDDIASLLDSGFASWIQYNDIRVENGSNLIATIGGSDYSSETFESSLDAGSTTTTILFDDVEVLQANTNVTIGSLRYDFADLESFISNSTLIETFDKPSGPGLGPDLNWTLEEGAGIWKTTNGRAELDSSSATYCYTDRSVGTNAMTAEIEVFAHNNTTKNLGVLCCSNGITDTGYLAMVTMVGTTGRVRIFKREAGVLTNIVDYVDVTNLAIPYTLKITHDGYGGLKAYVNDVEIARGIDTVSPVLTGQTGGIYSASTGCVVETFELGVLAPVVNLETFDKGTSTGLGPIYTWSEFGDSSWRTVDSEASASTDGVSYATAMEPIKSLFQWAEVTVTNQEDAKNLGLMLRMNGTSADDGYQLVVKRTDATGDTWKIIKRNGGVTSDLTAFAAIDWPATPFTLLMMDANGQITLYVNDIEVGSGSDSDLIENEYVGLYTTSRLNNFDNFRFGYGDRSPYPVLAAGGILQSVASSTVKFKLEEATQICVGVSAEIATSDNNTALLSITKSNGVEVATDSITWTDFGYSSIAATQDYIENDFHAIDLAPGEYAATVGGVTPGGVVVRSADEFTERLVSNGSNFSSSPFIIKDNGQLVLAGHGLNREFPRFIKSESDSPVQILPNLETEAVDRLHSSAVITRTPSRYVVFATDHNKQMMGVSATTVEGLATATEVQVGSGSNTYIHVVSEGERVWLFSRYAGSDGVMVVYFPNAADLSVNTVDWLTPTSPRMYPSSMQKGYADDGRVLIMCYMQHRDTNWRASACAILDPSVGTDGQWYNTAGNPIGGTTRGTSDANTRFSGTSWGAKVEDGGTYCVPESSASNRFIIGPPAMRIVAWNATTKQAALGIPWTQTDISDNIAANKALTDFGLTTISGATRVNALTGVSGGDDPFGMDGTNDKWGPGTAWWDGNDLIVCIADRGIPGRDREWWFSTDKTNGYHDQFGHALNVFRVTNALAQANGDDLKSAISLVRTYTPQNLGMGKDFKGEWIGVGAIHNFPGTNDIYLQVGINSFDHTVEQATYKVLTDVNIAP